MYETPSPAPAYFAVRLFLKSSYVDCEDGARLYKAPHSRCFLLPFFCCLPWTRGRFASFRGLQGSISPRFPSLSSAWLEGLCSHSAGTATDAFSATGPEARRLALPAIPWRPGPPARPRAVGPAAAPPEAASATRGPDDNTSLAERTGPMPGDVRTLLGLKARPPAADQLLGRLELLADPRLTLLPPAQGSNVDPGSGGGPPKHGPLLTSGYGPPDTLLVDLTPWFRAVVHRHGALDDGCVALSAAVDRHFNFAGIRVRRAVWCPLASVQEKTFPRPPGNCRPRLRQPLRPCDGHRAAWHRVRAAQIGRADQTGADLAITTALRSFYHITRGDPSGRLSTNLCGIG